MPAKIYMNLSNGNNYQQLLTRSINTASLAGAPRNSLNAPLNTGMITRIHNVRPGCGSCGRRAS
jgi:hypothetical protein